MLDPADFTDEPGLMVSKPKILSLTRVIRYNMSSIEFFSIQKHLPRAIELS